MTSNTLYIYQLIKPNGKKKITKSLTQRTDKGELIGTEYRLVAVLRLLNWHSYKTYHCNSRPVESNLTLANLR